MNRHTATTDETDNNNFDDANDDNDDDVDEIDNDRNAAAELDAIDDDIEEFRFFFDVEYMFPFDNISKICLFESDDADEPGVR